MLSERENKIFDALERYDPRIADAFREGISTMTYASPEKIVQSAHSLREVIYMMSKLSESKKSSKTNTDKRSYKLVNQHIVNLIQLVDPIGTSPKQSYILHAKLLSDKLNWLSNIAHHGEYPSDTVYPPHTEYQKGVDEFEMYLEKILEPHFQVIVKIDEILSMAKPTLEAFTGITKLIARDSSAYNYFFLHAQPHWLPFVLEKKYIKNPSHTTRIDEKNRFHWTHAYYLQKCASKYPDEVSQIILNLRILEEYDERHYLLDCFVKAVIEMPAEYGRLTVKKIYKEKWLRSYPYRLARPITELMKKMADASFEDETDKLVHALLDVKLGKRYVKGDGILEKFRSVQDVETIVDNHCYRELLEKEIPYAFAKFPETVTNRLICLVEKTVFLENHGMCDKDSKTDMSVAWRPAIENHEQNPEYDLKSQLVGKLGEFLVLIGEIPIPSFERIIEEMTEDNYPVFTRLKLYVYRKYCRQFKDKIDYAVENYFGVYELHHEYFHLLKDVFHHISQETRRKYFSHVDNGPDNDLIELWTQRAQLEGPDFVASRIKLWKAYKLAPILDHLTREEKEKFADFINVRGFEHPDFHSYISGVKTSEPATDLEDNLSPQKVIEFLKSYKPKELEFGYHDGTGVKFREYVKNMPNEFSELASQIMELDPNFVSEYFNGIRDAVRQEKPVNWEPVLSLCEKITKSTNQEGLRGSKVLRAIAYSIDEGLRTYSIDFILRDIVWKLLTRLVTLEDTDPSMEGMYPDKSWTSLTISRNTVNGVAFHSILCYAIWCNKHIKNKKLVPEVKKLISDYLDHKIPSSVSRQAVLGFYLPTLYWFDKKWIVARLGKLFSNKDEQLSKSAWDGYLQNNIIKVIFTDLVDKYDSHIRALEDPPLKDGYLLESDKLVVQHIARAYLFKFNRAKRLFNKMISHSHDAVLSYCAEDIAQILRQQKDEPDEFFDIDAFREIWRNSKLTTNREIQDWFRYSPLGKKETLELLYNSLEAADEGTDIPFPVKELESYAKTHPELTLEYLILLIEKGRKSLEYYGNADDLKIVLAILLKNPKTKEKTVALIHRLGELGYNEYGDLLK